ncbi:O-methyltransferase [Actinophytocola oryzae]|uniref:Putative O-methyltransferase YrrM n=1 Tax=Actinophytocola oryzae TaxID=502181 RepID=A0A4R7UXY1_9PSEU|nr:O-methyltransferase [Actinophytocola oryzae]TDV41743.1 putative O-methyltransferase YrrM [Actinophytocola oryzae]
MTQNVWSEVDDYISGLLVGQDEALDGALRRSDEAGLPEINVAPNQGKLLNLLARVHGARRILEFGTLAGYSTIWLARALPADGELITLEADPHHAEVARANIAAAGLADRVEVKVGKALDTLPDIDGVFDLFFVDADKVNNPTYFRWALDHSRPGSVIIVDNVIREGRVIEADSTDPSVLGTRELGSVIAGEPRVSATMVQTVGSKGYDGFALVLVER